MKNTFIPLDILFINEDFKISFTKGNPVGSDVQDTLNKIKVQELEDTFGWIVEAK